MDIFVNNVTALAGTCRKALKQALGGDLQIQLTPVGQFGGYDFDLRIDTKPPLRLIVEAKTRIAARTQALQIIFQLRRRMGKQDGAMVFADWIPEPVAEEFRKAGVFFVDAQGNAFLKKQPQIMLDIRGRKPDRPMKAEPGRLIEPGGLKVVHYLLTHPEAAGTPLRAIAEGAGVALGTAHAVRVELRRAQWLLPAAGGKVKFGNLEGLIELFVRGYALKLRPAYGIGRYRHRNNVPHAVLQRFAQRLAGLEGHWAVTGGMAAREMTHYLEPDAVALFVDEQARTALEGEHLLRDDVGGNVTPLLVYAELLQEGGQREIETAEMIYERFLETQAAHGK